MQRRKDVAEYLMHHITTPSEIIIRLKSKWPELDVHTVRNDAKWIKKQTRPWLLGLAKDGYAYDAMMGIAKLKSQEMELEEMKKQTHDPREKREIIKQIGELVIARLSIEGEGPVFLAVSS